MAQTKRDHHAPGPDQPRRRNRFRPRRFIPIRHPEPGPKRHRSPNGHSLSLLRRPAGNSQRISACINLSGSETGASSTLRKKSTKSATSSSSTENSPTHFPKINSQHAAKSTQPAKLFHPACSISMSTFANRARHTKRPFSPAHRPQQQADSQPSSACQTHPRRPTTPARSNTSSTPSGATQSSTSSQPDASPSEWRAKTSPRSEHSNEPEPSSEEHTSE